MKSDWFYYALAMRIATDLLITIAVPAVLAAWIGTLLDARFNSKPAILIILLILAATVSSISVYRKAKSYAKQFEQGPKE